MSSLRAPGLGPIVGHTTHTSCRLWIRAGDPADKGALLDSERRTLGVIGIVKSGKIDPKRAYYFRLPREFDRTGTFFLGEDVGLGRHETDEIPKRLQEAAEPLQPDTTYVVRMGTLTIDDPLPDSESVSDSELAALLPPVERVCQELLKLPAERSETSFRTFPAEAPSVQTLGFLIGSCRYPGLLWKVKEADRIFEPMADQVQLTRPDPARFVLMMGDQIYGDMLNRHVPIGLADTYEEFQDRYVSAFGAPNLRRLLRSCPTYMAIDDHEIEDNWTQDRIRDSDKRRLFHVAIGAYLSYQWSHGPRTFGRNLHYQFACGGYPFFVLDTRTQRFVDDEEGLRDNHLLGRPSIDPVHPGQLGRLLTWLEEQQATRGNAPKFIVSSSVFAPSPVDERIDPALLPAGRPSDDAAVLFEANRKRREKSDTWSAFPNTRGAILESIVGKRIHNVIFLTGDVHCANVARMEFDGLDAATDLAVHDVTSSAFYWPFPFADGDPNTYVHDSRAAGQIDGFPLPGIGEGVRAHYRAWGFTQEDNFCRLELDKAAHTLTVRVFDREGKVVKVANDRGKIVDKNVLPLVPWS